MRNRYGTEYFFTQLDENIYQIMGDLDYWRFGGKEGQDKIDTSDLGMVDPSGGPYLEVGMKLPSVNKPIRRIFVDDRRICFEVDNGN